MGVIMSVVCIDCDSAVTTCMHAVSCDICEGWHHRRCGTEMMELLLRGGPTLLQSTCRCFVSKCPSQPFSTSASLRELQKLSRVTVVDNSMLGRRAQLSGKRPYIIHVYNKMSRGYLGDKVLLAISGKKKRAYIVGCRQQQKAMVPRFDSNNVVLIEDNGTPTATRIRSPIPSVLRGKEGDFTKILSMATKFV